MSRVQDILSILRSLKLISEACIKLQEENIKLIWRNSSIRPIVEDVTVHTKNVPKAKNVSDLVDSAKEGADRISAVIHGLKVYTEYALNIGKITKT